MINIGNISIADIFIGDSGISKIYCGNDIVWEKSQRGTILVVNNKSENS